MQDSLYKENQVYFNFQINRKEEKTVYPRPDVTNAYQKFLRLHENEALNYSKAGFIQTIISKAHYTCRTIHV